MGASIGEISLLHSLSTLAFSPSGPEALWTFGPSNSLATPFGSFFLYILPDPLSSIIGRCTLYTPGCRMTCNHIEITVGFFNLHKGWLSLHRGHPVNVPIRRTMHLSSVIPANDTMESVLGHQIFFWPRAGIEPGTSSTNHWATTISQLLCPPRRRTV